MQQFWKKKLAVLLVVAMLFTLLPTAVLAEGDTVTLDITQGDITITATGYKVGDASEETAFTGSYKITGNSTETDNHITVAGGTHKITLEDVNIVSKNGAAFDLQNKADVTLILEGENKLQGNWVAAGLHVPAGTVLTVKGDGSLDVTGGSAGNNGGAGIGGDNTDVNFGDITIALQDEGSIIATGERSAAGIGGGGQISNTVPLTGNITIQSGNVIANGGEYAAAIGSGVHSENHSVITITGGTVTAKGTNGAAIGGGYGTDNSASVILIAGGAVNAESNVNGAGIGVGGYAKGGTVLITGGEVTAQGGTWGAGIGGGRYTDGGKILITGGTVKATGDSVGADIGGGEEGAGGTILIAGSTVKKKDGSAVSIGGGSKKTQDWDGIVIGVEGTENTVHRNPTIFENFTIPAGVTITIGTGQTVTIPEGMTLTNNGMIINYGTMIGTVTNNGKLLEPAATPTDEDFQIDYTAEKIVYNDPLVVYAWDGTAIESGSSITDYIGKTIYVRVKKTDEHLESPVLPVFLPERLISPTGLQGNNTSFAGEKDGSITGVTIAMEYRAEDDDWIGCEGTEISNLPAGTYLVRVKATNASFASPAVTVEIAEGAARTYVLNMSDIVFPDAEQGTAVDAQTIKISNTGNSDATITSLTVDNDEFILSGSDTTVPAGDTLDSYTIQPIANLPVGTHEAKLTVVYDESKTTTSAVSFTVTKAAKPEPPEESEKPSQPEEPPTKPSTGGGSSSGGGFSGHYNYSVKADSVDGAQIAIDKSSAIAGEQVVITVTPNSGKQVKEVIVTDSKENVLTVTKIGENKYRFIMPEGAVKVAVTTAKAEYDTRVVLQIGNKNVVIGDRTFVNDVTPVIVDNRTMVPIRLVTEALGGRADWNEATRTVTLNIDGNVLRMTIDQTIAGFDAAPMIHNSRTYVPIRYVAEALGANVEWIAETQQIIIEK